MRTDLVRDLRRWDIVALLINGVIGAGIFGLPSKVFALASSYSLLAYIICAAVVILIILCFAEVSSRFTSTGGPYLYARRTFGPLIGFEVGWLLWLSRVTAFATVCNLFVLYVGFFWPDATADPWRPILITAAVLVLTIINLMGIRQAAMVSNLFAIGKLIPIVLFIGVGLFFVKFESFSLADAPSFNSLTTAVMLLVFAFSGFEVATINAGEVRDPRRDYPPAMFIAMTSVVVIYLLIQFVCIGTLPGLADSERPLADAASTFAGATGASIIVLGALISMSGTLNAALLGCTRLPFALAEQGQMPQLFAATHPRFHTPYVSILISSAVILVVTLAHSFMTALTINTITKLLTYAIVCLSLPILRKRGDVEEAKFRVRGGVAVSVLALLLCVWLLSSVSWGEGRDVAIALAAGMVLYLVYRIRKRPA
jgi:amino acid transporter